MRLTVLNRFSPDPHRAPATMTDDQREHPVVRLIRRRRDEGSKPGARADGRRVALIIEGGGMRGVVSAGMTAAIEQLGLRDAFDEVHGASAGAFNGAFLLAGQAAYLTALYPHGFGDPSFVNFRDTLLRRRPIFDMDYVIGEVWRHQRPLRTDEILSCGIELHCTATDVESTQIADLADLRDDDEIRCAMRASGRLPWLAGPPVAFRGRRWLDATLAEAIPVHAAQTTATDMLVLQTRPHGIQHTPLSSAVARLTDGYLAKVNPALVTLRESRSERYDELSDELAARAGDPAATPAVCVIRPPADALLVGQMENRVSALTTAGSHGLRAAWMALEGEDPELLATPRAYTRGATSPDSTRARADSSADAQPDAESVPMAGRQAL
ncbi:MAG TPA: patatin-like phospholipase family protein [Solirubrobacteraceae bacterium]|jgi:predicted patatin/cPLA2 family phospholipase